MWFLRPRSAAIEIDDLRTGSEDATKDDGGRGSRGAQGGPANSLRQAQQQRRPAVRRRRHGPRLHRPALRPQRLRPQPQHHDLQLPHLRHDAPPHADSLCDGHGPGMFEHLRHRLPIPLLRRHHGHHDGHRSRQGDRRVDGLAGDSRDPARRRLLLGGVVNFSIPSAGGEWAVIGPPLVDAVRELTGATTARRPQPATLPGSPWRLPTASR